MWKVMPVGMAFVLVAIQLSAQPPAGKQGKQKDFSNSSIVTRMMAFNIKKDGKLTKDEVTDPRLHRLFDQADANKDGVVTKEELMALAAKLDEEFGQGGGGPGGKGGFGGGPGGFGGPKGPKGKGPGAFGTPPQPGQILAPFLQEQLNLSGDQKKRLKNLQNLVDSELAKILTDQQRQQLKELANNGPGNFGPPAKGGSGGKGGFGPPKGGPGGPFGDGPPKDELD